MAILRANRGEQERNQSSVDQKSRKFQIFFEIKSYRMKIKTPENYDSLWVMRGRSYEFNITGDVCFFRSLDFHTVCANNTNHLKIYKKQLRKGIRAMS